MKIVSMEQELKSNAYPGRGIVIGKTPDGTKAVAAYFIMGRSENSRNRVGEVPKFSEFECNQDEFLEALLRAIETKVNISTLLKKRIIDYSNPNIQY